MLTTLCVLLAWRLRLSEVRADEAPITDQGLSDVPPGPDWGGQGTADSDIQGPQGSDIMYPDPDPSPEAPVTADTEECQCRSMRRCVDCEDLRPCPGDNR